MIRTLVLKARFCSGNYVTVKGVEGFSFLLLLLQPGLSLTRLPLMAMLVFGLLRGRVDL